VERPQPTQPLRQPAGTLPAGWRAGAAMSDHLLIDYSRQPPQIRCLCCGFAEDLQLPMAIRALEALARRLEAGHRACQSITTNTP